MPAKKLNHMNKMSVEGRSPSHSRSSGASFQTLNASSISFEIKGIGLRLEVVVIEVSGHCSLDRIRIKIFPSEA